MGQEEQRRPALDLPDWLDRPRAATAVLAVLAGGVAFALATQVFPYRSLNHDEAVYLQQAAMLLEGRLFLHPPVEDAFHPWFFVVSDRGLYPKYAPVPALVFAVGRLVGAYEVALVGVAAAQVALVVGLGRELYDAGTGLLAGCLLLVSPLFLVQAGVFLPYAVTSALNCAFALAYLRGERLESRLLAAAAGGAIGLAFFARPYTALLFALPFVAHAVWTLGRARAWRGLAGDAPDGVRALLTRRVLTAGLGILGVAVTLGYNWVVTGDPLLFPYQAFAPEDGIGFGHRQILGHEVDYDLALALRSNVQVLRRLFTDWVAGGLVGTALAGVGLVALARARYRAGDGVGDGHDGIGALSKRTVLAGLFLSVPVGNLAFWGNFNVLGNLAVATDGLIYYLGPYYHYDLLVPTAVFAAAGGLALFRGVRSALHERVDARAARQVTLALAVVSAAAFGAVAAGPALDPLERNREVTAEFERSYAPFTETPPPADAVVFLPTVYGPWLNHPFQPLRNDPGYDQGRVYALGDIDELRVAEAFPERPLYRYVHTGTWVPVDDSSVSAELRRVERASGGSVRLLADLGIPERASTVTVRVETDAESEAFVVNGTPSTLPLALVVAPGRVSVEGERLVPTGDRTVDLDADDEVHVEVFVQTGATSGFTYSLAFPVASESGGVRALSATEQWCRVPTRCVPAGMGDSGEGVFVDARLVSGNETAA